jgi:hypothetical protein
MKMQKYFKALIFICAVFISFISSTAVADDNIERSCRAKYGLYIVETVNSEGRIMKKIDGHALLDPKYEFSARRGCGRLVPNRCRQRAGEAALQCMTAHANAPANKPAACTSNGVDNYSITNLEAPVQEVACRVVKQYLGSEQYKKLLPLGIRTTVKAFVEGDKGCGGGNEKYKMEYVSTIVVTCNN